MTSLSGKRLDLQINTKYLASRQIFSWYTRVLAVITKMRQTIWSAFPFRSSFGMALPKLRVYLNEKTVVGAFLAVYYILSRLLYLAFSANLGLLCMPYPGMGPLV